MFVWLDRTAERTAEQILLEGGYLRSSFGCSKLRAWIRLVEVVRGIKRIVPQVFVRSTVPLIAAGLRYDADMTAASTAEAGIGVRGDNPVLLDCLGRNEVGNVRSEIGVGPIYSDETGVKPFVI